LLWVIIEPSTMPSKYEVMPSRWRINGAFLLDEPSPTSTPFWCSLLQRRHNIRFQIGRRHRHQQRPVGAVLDIHQRLAFRLFQLHAIGAEDDAKAFPPAHPPELVVQRTVELPSILVTQLLPRAVVEFVSVADHAIKIKDTGKNHRLCPDMFAISC
jgi:hypothetical protein